MRYKDFRPFHIKRAKAFKRDLAEQRNQRSANKTTLYVTLTALKRFFLWPAGPATSPVSLIRMLAMLQLTRESAKHSAPNVCCIGSLASFRMANAGDGPYRNSRGRASAPRGTYSAPLSFNGCR
jgi:hypothetical protein